MKLIFRTVLAALLFSQAGCVLRQAAVEPPVAAKGVLDLRQWNGPRDGPVPLNGDWEWYWKRFVPPAQFAKGLAARPDAYLAVPGVWNEHVLGPMLQRGMGHATYRLRVLVSSRSPLSLKFLTAATASVFYIDGQRIGGGGSIGTAARTSQPGYRPFTVTFTPRSDTVELVAHVSNFHYRKGGLWNIIELGTPAQIDQVRLRKISRDYFLAGSFLLIGLYHLFIWLFLRQRLPVLFGAFCLLVVVRILTTGEHAIQVWWSWPWTAVIHAELLSFFLMVPVFTAFSHQAFPDETSPLMSRFFIVAGVLFSALAVLFPPVVFTYAIRPFQVLLVIAFVYGLWTYTRALRRRRSGSIYYLLGFLILFAAVLNDILFTSFFVRTGHYFYVGLFVFIFSQAIALSKQFSQGFENLETANRKLGAANRELAVLNEQMSLKNQAIEEKNELLTKVNAELDAVVYRVSHDLRSPIASVLGLIGIARDEHNPGQVRNYMDMQEKTLLRMDAHIQDIIDYSRNNRSELKTEPVDLRRLIEEVLADHSHLPGAGAIEKTVRVKQSGVFYSDEKRLAMVLNNLVSNAIRYHNPYQDHPFVRVNVQADAREACIEIQDNGQGIGPDHLPKVFDMFYRANEKTKGSGLGLYIVKEAVEKMGGTISVQSEPGKGTVFFVTLPNGNP